MATKTKSKDSTTPRLAEHHLGRELQTFDQIRDMPLGLPEDSRRQVIEELRVIAADSRILRDLQKKHHWNMRGRTFYQLHLLLDTHAEQQDKLIDELSERIQMLGGVAPGDPRHVAELTTIDRAPDGVESVAAMLSRTIEADEAILTRARHAAEVADEAGDPGSEDLLSSSVIPINETQVWFTVEHLVEIPLIED
jgi:starvation-inducible DNA-binding protein